MKMIVEGPSSILMGGKFPFLVLQISVSKCGAWNFVILVKVSTTGVQVSLLLGMEYLFAYQFWYWELWVENLWGGERKHYFFSFFPASLLLMSVDEGWCGWFYTPVCSYKVHALTVYLHSTFTVPLIGDAFGIESNICGGAFLQKYSTC